MTAPIAPPRPGMVRVSEIFGPTLQGEGPLVGQPTVFVRTGGCDFRCSWCDSLHAVLPEHRATWTPMWPGTIVERVLQLSGGKPLTVTLSGGNPALQPLGPLIEEGHRARLKFALETQGSAPRPWMQTLDQLVLSPKPPSAGVAFTRSALDACLILGKRANPILKVPVFDEDDLEWALALHAIYPRVPFYLSAGNSWGPAATDAPTGAALEAALLQRLRWLSDAVLARRVFDVIVLPQLHTLIWGNDRGR